MPYRVTSHLNPLSFPTRRSSDLLSAAIDNDTSSFWIVPVATEVLSVVCAVDDGDALACSHSAHFKPVSNSPVVSPLTLIVSVLVVSPAVNVNVPVGNELPKSEASAASTVFPDTS